MEKISNNEQYARQLNVELVEANKAQNYESFRDIINKYKELYDQTGYDRAKLAYLTGSGILNNYIGRLDLSLTFYKEALKFSKEINQPRILITNYNNIAAIYGEQKLFNRQIEYLEMAEQECTKFYTNLDTTNLTDMQKNQPFDSIYIGLATAYSYLKKYNIALDYAKKALGYAITNKAVMNQITIYSGIGLFNYKLNKLKEAVDFCQKAIKLAQKSNIFVKLKNSHRMLSFIYYNEKDYKKALENLLLAEAASKKFPDTYIYSTYYHLSKTYHKMGNSVKALEAFELYTSKKKLIDTNQKKTSFLLAEIYNTHKREKNELEDIVHVSDLVEDKFTFFKEQFEQVAGIGKIGFFSDKMNALREKAEIYHNNRNLNVLIHGETGVGKEIFAKLIHFGKMPITKPFVAINCAAIPSELFESEIFGYEGESFTDAIKSGKKGKIEMAENGTLFLDEIGEIPLDIQTKLLRVIQEKEFYKVGGSKKIKANVRFIFATNRDLLKEMNAKNFRQDFYYRITEAEIEIPSLKERKEEIIPITQMFLKEFSKVNNKEYKLTKKAAELLKHKYWAGNIRELKNVLEKSILLSESNIINEDNLLINKQNDSEKSVFKLQIPMTEGIGLDELEEKIVLQQYNRFDGNISKTQQYLKTYRNKVYGILRKNGIK